jgi:polyhydroxyalkanoate synthesis regulator phasin
MNLDTLNQGDLFTEIAELARVEGIANQAEWNELVDEVVESHADLGELNNDQALEQLREALKMSWSQYQRESGPETGSAIAEDPRSPHA